MDKFLTITTNDVATEREKGWVHTLIANSFVTADETEN